MTTPELVFGLVGPIGVNMDLVQERLSSLLRGVGYRSEILHLTKLMPKFLEGAGEADGAKRTLDQKIQQANDFRSQVKDDSVLAALAVAEIRNCRKALHVENGRAETDELRNEPFPSTAYIIRQLKRPEEVSKLKKVYGEKFVQISVALDKDTRIKNLIAKIADGGALLHKSCLGFIS